MKYILFALFTCLTVLGQRTPFSVNGVVVANANLTNTATITWTLNGSDISGGGGGGSVLANGSSVTNPNFTNSATATVTVGASTNITINPTNIANAQISASAAIDVSKLSGAAPLASPTFTGTVRATNIIGNVMPVINAAAAPYSADTTGVSDATAAIQLALDAAAFSRVFLPRGTYRIDGTLIVDPGQTLEGESSQWGFSTILQKGGLSTNAIVKFATGDGMQLRNICISGNNKADGVVGVQSSTTGASTSWKLDNVRIISCGVGVILSNAWTSEIVSSYIYDCTTGISALNQVNAIKIRGSMISNCTKGIEIYGANENYGWDINGTFELNTYAIWLDAYTFDINIHGSYFEGNNYTLFANTAYMLTLHDSLVSSGAGITVTNIVLANCHTVTISGNILTAGGSGINGSIDSASSGILLQNNFEWLGTAIADNSINSIKIATNIVVKNGYMQTKTQMIFEGTTEDAVETILTVVDPTSSDKTITLPNATGTVVLQDDTATLSNKTITYSAALGTDDTYQGTQITGLNNTGGVTQWDVVYLNGSSQWVLADANGSSTYPAWGLATATASTGNATTVVINGTVRNDAWNWTSGGTIYLSTTAGSITQTAPSGTGDKVQVVGVALTADIILLKLSTDYGTAP